MRDFDYHIKTLNTTLLEHLPEKISPSWILVNSPSAYRHIVKYVRDDYDYIDWDRVTSGLDREFQKRWMQNRQKQVILYEKQSEVDVLLTKYKSKLYTFICNYAKEDRVIQDKLMIGLVRLGQKGNILAQNEIVKWTNYIIDDWIDKYPQICKWKGYRDEVDDKVKCCIRCYRYTGSFLGYLFRTLEFSARGKPMTYSLDDKFADGEKTRIDYIVINEKSYNDM
jgi:hypothetical protein